MSSKTIPTPYVWTYQPQSGRAAGAAQDYSTRLNWMGAGPSMINQVYDIRDKQNQILMTQAAISETPRTIANPPTWPAHLLPQAANSSMTVTLPRNEALEAAMTNSGAQLAGGYRAFPLPPYVNSIKAYPPFYGGAVQLHERTLPLRPDGLFQLGGGSRTPFDLQQGFLTLQQGSSAPRSGGLGPAQFVQEFVPEVYLNPFSGPPETFPNQFMPNYDIVTDSIDGYE